VIRRWWERVKRLLDPTWYAYLDHAAEHAAAIEQEQAQWRAANPELAATGCPPPPTPLSMTHITYGYW
jgi:hypothetical protein